LRKIDKNLKKISKNWQNYLTVFSRVSYDKNVNKQSTKETKMTVINQLPTGEEQEGTLRITLVGPRRILNLIIHILHNLKFAHATDWCRLQPTKNEGEFITILMRKV